MNWQFKIWDGKKMRYAIDMEEIAGELSYLVDLYRPDCTFLCFTGLQDQHGTDIYEKDIVEYRVRGLKHQVGGTEDKDDLDHKARSIVVFRGGYFGLSNYRYDDCQIIPLGFNPSRLGQQTINQICEVVGNIYENKELLT